MDFVINIILQINKWSYIRKTKFSAFTRYQKTFTITLIFRYRKSNIYILEIVIQYILGTFIYLHLYSVAVIKNNRSLQIVPHFPNRILAIYSVHLSSNIRFLPKSGIKELSIGEEKAPNAALHWRWQTRYTSLYSEIKFVNARYACEGPGPVVYVHSGIPEFRWRTVPGVYCSARPKCNPL